MSYSNITFIENSYTISQFDKYVYAKNDIYLPLNPFDNLEIKIVNMSPNIIYVNSLTENIQNKAIQIGNTNVLSYDSASNTWNVTEIASNKVTLNQNDLFYLTNSLYGELNVVLPLSPPNGTILLFKDFGSANLNNIVLETPELIDGGATKIISDNYKTIELLFNGTTWTTLQSKIPAFNSSLLSNGTIITDSKLVFNNSTFNFISNNETDLIVDINKSSINKKKINQYYLEQKGPFINLPPSINVNNLNVSNDNFILFYDSLLNVGNKWIPYFELLSQANNYDNNALVTNNINQTLTIDETFIKEKQGFSLVLFNSILDKFNNNILELTNIKVDVSTLINRLNYIDSLINTYIENDVFPLTEKGDLWTYTTINSRMPISDDNKILVANCCTNNSLSWENITNLPIVNINTFNANTENVTTATIINSNITNATIVTENVTNSTINNSQINTGNLTNTTIDSKNATTSNITNLTVDNATIGTENITNSTIANATIGTENVTNSTINTANITNATIGTENVTTSTLGTVNITTAIIGTQVVTNSTVGTKNTQNSSINNANITNAVIDTENVTTSNITTANITSLKIGNWEMKQNQDNDFEYSYMGTPVETIDNTPPPVVPPEDPTSNMALWYDASDVTTLWQDQAGTTNQVTSDGQTILHWKDRSFKGTNMSNSSGPVYEYPGVNGIGNVLFSNNQLIPNPITPLSYETDAYGTMIIVCMPSPVAGQENHPFWYNGWGGSNIYDINHHSSELFGMTLGQTGVNLFVPNTVMIYVVTTDNSITQIYVNDVTAGNHVYEKNNPLFSYILSQWTMGPFTGKLCELRVYDTKLTNVELQNIVDILVPKWGIDVNATLPATALEPGVEWAVDATRADTVTTSIGNYVPYTSQWNGEHSGGQIYAFKGAAYNNSPLFYDNDQTPYMNFRQNAEKLYIEPGQQSPPVWDHTVYILLDIIGSGWNTPLRVQTSSADVGYYDFSFYNRTSSMRVIFAITTNEGYQSIDIEDVSTDPLIANGPHLVTYYAGANEMYTTINGAHITGSPMTGLSLTPLPAPSVPMILSAGYGLNGYIYEIRAYNGKHDNATINSTKSEIASKFNITL